MPWTTWTLLAARCRARNPATRQRLIPGVLHDRQFNGSGGNEYSRVGIAEVKYYEWITQAPTVEVSVV